jgi:hypothetical protein
MTCYTKEPPTVTETQLATAHTQGKLTDDEYNKILATKEPVPTEPTTTTEAPPV